MESIWTKNTEKKDFEVLSGNQKTDTVVIGGGMAGVLTAYYLQQVGVPVIVLEANRVGSGQTRKTTAKITSQHNLIYEKLLRVFGKEKAIHYARANEKAIDAYEQLIEKEKIDCGFVRCSSFLFSRTGEELLRSEEKAAEQLHLPVRYTQKTELPFSVAGALEFQNQAKFHPLHFLYHLADQLTVYEKTKVLRVDGNGLSFRSQGDILLFGGGSHRTGKNKKGGKYEMFREKAEEFWPGCRETACWSAQDAMTLDGVPYIGKFSGKKENWYVATGFGKWGMTSSMVSARLLTAEIIGHPFPEADIFSPQRKITGEAIKGLANHSIQMVMGMGKRLIPFPKRKNSKGEKVIPVCPHMGCRLIWNPEEKTYECPCHGSRFDKEGHLLDDPAQTDCLHK